MSRGAQENERVRRQITEALFSLMERQSFSSITVTQIIAEAGVARASYYRNYGDKEDIINAWMERLHDELQPADTQADHLVALSEQSMAEGFERSLTKFLSMKSYVLTLYRNGFSSLIQTTVNRYVKRMIGQPTKGSVDQYKLYFIAGAASNVLITWLNNGAVESPRTIARSCARWIASGVAAVSEPIEVGKSNLAVSETTVKHSPR